MSDRPRKRPRDFSQAAKLVIDIATGQVEDRSLVGRRVYQFRHRRACITLPQMVAQNLGRALLSANSQTPRSFPPHRSFPRGSQLRQRPLRG